MSDRKTVLWQEMRRTEFEEAAAAGAVVVIPMGSTEQHGRHLPVNTDLHNAQTIAVRAAQLVEEFPVIVAPPIWSGLSAHHMRFPGTITLSFQTMVGFLTDVCSSIAAHGFKKIILLNGHGGNVAIINAVCNYKLKYEDEIQVLPLTYWETIPEAMNEISEVDGGSIGHAGEMETSLELYLQEELVDKSQAAWAPGVGGDPTAGNKEKGERIVEAAAKRLAEIIREYRAKE